MKFSLILLVAAVSAFRIRTDDDMQVGEEDQVLAQSQSAIESEIAGESQRRHHHHRHHHRRHEFFKHLGRDMGDAARYLAAHPKLDEAMLKTGGDVAEAMA